jgi:hypothetical protein
VPFCQGQARLDNIGAADVRRRKQSRGQLDAAGPEHTFAQSSQQPMPRDVGVRALREREFMLGCH